MGKCDALLLLNAPLEAFSVSRPSHSMKSMFSGVFNNTYFWYIFQIFYPQYFVFCSLAFLTENYS
jgi:hypothetical protein